MVRGIAVYYASSEFNLAKGLLRRANQLVLVASLVVSGAGCVIAFVFLHPPESWVLCAAMPLIPLTTLTFVRQAAMQAIGRVVTGQFPEFVLRPVLIIGTVGVLALAGNGALTAVTALGANGLGGAAALVFGAVLLRRALPAPIRDVRASYETRLWLRASLPMMVISGIWAANNYTTTVLVGALRGSGAAGIYGVVENGAQLIVLLLMAANLPLAPIVARMHATNDHEASRADYGASCTGDLSRITTRRDRLDRVPRALSCDLRTWLCLRRRRSLFARGWPARERTRGTGW